MMKPEAWSDYQQRSDRIERLQSYFSTEEVVEHLGCQNIHSAISVGTAEGAIDLCFLKACPNMKEYLCIEPVEALLKMAEKNLQESYPTIRVKGLVGTFDDYRGEEESLDAVLFIHSIYAFLGDLETPMTKAMSLLKDGGKLIIIISHGTFFEILDDVYGKTEGGAKLKLLCQTLKKLKFNFTEDALEDITCDLSQEGQEFFGFFDILNERDMTKSQKMEMVSRLKEICVQGTNKVSFQQKSFIITKESLKL